ncbi:hypothetical protein [Desulfonema magnum]|uniref:Uncharacterized protein n=1 Tax=Desulfonema magnum TaxID=45655 RepID=A0A975BSU1_9BACT|nr:hypothetical protein [Desulfonema magnum]QTA90983.1 Uncharacterized protein dnm_070470 [Desulfonema magnum]
MERSGTVFCIRPALRKSASLYFRTPESGQKKRFAPHAEARLKKRSAKIEWSEAERFFACALPCEKALRSIFALRSSVKKSDSLRTPKPG